ncbi:hypothetical protein GCM10023262_07300 [Bartonella pachyuromydis]|uniref:Uncharacterized protein n=1 Tax=Bartonella pachyuromydis TaxID=931097 RepID=A0ABP8VFR3_9HYPH
MFNCPNEDKEYKFCGKKNRENSFLFSDDGINYALLTSFVIITRYDILERATKSTLKVNCRYADDRVKLI